MVVLLLNADSTLAAVEGTWRAHYHASGAQRQRVGLFVWVDDESILETIVSEEVVGSLAVKGPLSLTLVLHMNSVLLHALISDFVTASRRDCGHYAWLCASALPHKSNQI